MSNEDQEMLVKHIQAIIHSNTKIDVYEAVEDIVYDYVTENKIGDFHMEISYFYLMIYLQHAQINLGIMHKVSPMPIHFGKFTSRFFVCIDFTICSATYVGFNMYRPIFFTYVPD